MSTNSSIYGAIFGGLLDGLAGASIGSLIGSTQDTNNPIGDLATNGAVQLGVGIGGGAAIGALAGGGAAAAPVGGMAPMQAGVTPMAIDMPAAPSAATVANANATIAAPKAAQFGMISGAANGIGNALQQNAAKGEAAGQQMITQNSGQNQTPGLIPLPSVNLTSPTYKTIFGT